MTLKIAIASYLANSSCTSTNAEVTVDRDRNPFSQQCKRSLRDEKTKKV